MSKRKIFCLCLLIVIIVAISIAVSVFIKDIDKKKDKRYMEIRESVKKAVEWNIRGMYPNCQLINDFKEISLFYDSSFLIRHGYIKKSELLDVDNKSYCDVYVTIDDNFKDPQNHQHDCTVAYKFFLKCNDYEDEGYKKW